MITNDQANVKNNYIELLEMKKQLNSLNLRVSLTDADGESNLEARYEITLESNIETKQIENTKEVKRHEISIRKIGVPEGKKKEHRGKPKFLEIRTEFLRTKK